MSELYKVFGIEKKAPGIVGYIFAFGYYALIYMEEYLPGEKHTWFMLLFMAYLICQMAVLVFSYPKYNTQQIMAAFFGVFYVAVMLSYKNASGRSVYRMACVYLFVGMRYMCILCRHAHRKA